MFWIPRDGMYRVIFCGSRGVRTEVFAMRVPVSLFDGSDEERVFSVTCVDDGKRATEVVATFA